MTDAIAQIFTNARTQNGWLDQPVGDDLLRKIYDAMKFAPTAFNCCPLRIVFVRSPAAKEKLKPTLMAGNVNKSMTAPAVAIFARDMKFYEHLPKLFPVMDAKAFYVGNDAAIVDAATRNATLQAAYFMLAARAHGLDCAPMSGFDPQKVNEAFFPDGRFKVDFICGLGHGDPAKVYPRGPRFTFEEVCQIQ